MKTNPCPFCGYVGVSLNTSMKNRTMAARCKYCGAQGSEVKFNNETFIDAEVAAIDGWNARFHPPNFWDRNAE